MFKYIGKCLCRSQTVRKLSNTSLLLTDKFENSNIINKDIIGANTQQNSNFDILLKNIKSASDVSDVLLSVKMHHQIMNNRHTIQAFKSIFALQKSESSGISNGEITKSPEFKVLCQTLKGQIRTLSIEDRIDALKVLSFLGVPSTTKIVQVLLLTITKSINDLSLQQLTFFDFLIKDFASCPLVDALQIAVPIVFETNLKTKVDSYSIGHLTDLLHFAGRKNLSTSSTFLINLILKKRLNIDFKCASSVIRSICDLKINDERHKPLLHHALDVIVENETKCTYNDFDLLTSKLVSKFSLKNNYFYHEEFLNSACNFIITNNCEFNEGIWLLRKALKFGHVCHELLDFLITKIEDNPILIENCGTIILFTIVNGLAQADYRPDNWAFMEPLILENAKSHLNQIELPWMKFIRDLCTLDCWPFEIFEKIFCNDFLEKYLARDYNKLDILQVLMLYQAVKSLCPWYSGPWPNQGILDKAISINGTNVTDYPLGDAIAKGLGGSRFVRNGVFTKLGHFIDHLIIMRQGEYPVPFNDSNINENERLYIEDLTKNIENQMIAILLLPQSAFTSNTSSLKGSTRLFINSLEVYGPSVVDINSTYWEQLTETEKIPYVMERVRTVSR